MNGVLFWKVFINRIKNAINISQLLTSRTLKNSPKTKCEGKRRHSQYNIHNHKYEKNLKIKVILRFLSFKELIKCKEINRRQ